MDPIASPSSSRQSSIHSSRCSTKTARVHKESTLNINTCFDPPPGHANDLLTLVNSLRTNIVDVSTVTANTLALDCDTEAGRCFDNGTFATSPMNSKDQCRLAEDKVVKERVDSRLPFHKWMKSIHRRARQRPGLSMLNVSHHYSHNLDSEDGFHSTQTKGRFHRQSSSGSSFAFVTAVRSASISLASESAVTRSRRNTARSPYLSPTERSSRASMSGPRVSEDGIILEAHRLVDTAATERAMRRRKVLEELISTEEGYIGDIRFLMNVYVTILASVPAICAGLRSSINRNLTEIVEFHEQILGELHRIVPHSEYTQIDPQSPPETRIDQTRRPRHGHRRWASVPEHNGNMSWLQRAPGMLCDPQVAAEVSKIFGKKMSRFFIYKEYGATYEIMMKDIASTHHVMPDWEANQKGLEALASTLGPIKNNANRSKQALTMNDLLVKPIQRVCRYPLLFSELLKYTPASDCPNSHMEINDTLARLREATAEINRATDDVRMKTTLERTWLLQDRLVFPNRKLDAFSKNQIRSFGHIRLCGTLHGCWQTKTGVEGHYLICLLYRDFLCFASPGKIEQIYTLLACINLSQVKVEDVDNGRGLQCHTAPYSWKIVFECDHQLYEMILTACSPKEEVEWRARMNKPCKEGGDAKDSNLFSSLYLNIKSQGTVFGKPGTMARRISIHRATTIGSKSTLCQVVLKNTNALPDILNSASAALTINRSQSLLTTNARVPILAPARSERARIEALLADIWSREILPFPAMTTRSRSEHLVRSSANTVMRKLSVASITSSFSKRSGSFPQRVKSNGSELLMEGAKRQDIKGGTEEAAAAAAADDAAHDTESCRKKKRQRVEHMATELAHFGLSSSEPTPIEYQMITADPKETGGSIDELDDRQWALQQVLCSTMPELSRLIATVDNFQPAKENRAIYKPRFNDRARSYGRWSKTSGMKVDSTGLGFRNFFSLGREA